MRCEHGQARTRQLAVLPAVALAGAPAFGLAGAASGRIDVFADDGDLAAVSGHFSVPANYQVPDADGPDVTRSIEISGTLDARLPKRSSP